jgi:iron complex transport system ATP-binding protein
MIELRNVEVSLAGRKVVHGVSFTAPAGALTAIIGPNGSGKTTTMKAMSGEKKYRGRILFNGGDLRSLTPSELAQSRGVLAQSSSLGFPFLVREVLEMGLFAGHRGNETAARDAMARALAAVDLAGFETRLATRLSGGEQARMHMARVLCQISEPVRDGTPNWLFLDEPVASLDIRHQLAIMAIARDFAARGGGVVAVMHDLNLTAMFADHVVLLKSGRIEGEGRPQAVLTADRLEAVYGCRLEVDNDRETGLIRVLTPRAA